MGTHSDGKWALIPSESGQDQDAGDDAGDKIDPDGLPVQHGQPGEEGEEGGGAHGVHRLGCFPTRQSRNQNTLVKKALSSRPKGEIFKPGCDPNPQDPSLRFGMTAFFEMADSALTNHSLSSRKIPPCHLDHLSLSSRPPTVIPKRSEGSYASGRIPGIRFLASLEMTSFF